MSDSWRDTYSANFQINQREFDEFVYLYIVEYHVVERALKERYLKGQSVRAVIFVDIGG